MIGLGAQLARAKDGGRILLALDIDGTLTDGGHQPSADVCSALRTLASHGVVVVLATGRQLHNVEPVRVALGLAETWVVASDGAIVARYVGTREAMLTTDTFDPRPLAAALLDLDPSITLGAEDVGAGYLVNRRFDKLISRDDRQHVVDEFPSEVTMFTAGSTTATGAQLATRARALGLSCTGWDELGMGWLDAAAPGLSKASGVASVVTLAAPELDLSVAVGDFYNDLALLRWADVGVAMGHAPQDVLAAANYVTGAIEEDGLAHVLEELLAVLIGS